jgi:ATP-binding cassette subfamily B protein
MKHAAILDLDQFEDSAFYDKLEAARQQTIGDHPAFAGAKPGAGLNHLLFLSAGLVVFNPWLMVLLFIAVLPAFLGEAYFNDKSYALNRRQTPERRELDYIRYVGASDETARK